MNICAAYTGKSLPGHGLNSWGLQRFDFNSCSSLGLTAELRGAIGSASVQQLYPKRLSTIGEGGGIHCKIVVTNRAQRCEMHKLALFLVGGRVVVLRAGFCCCHFGHERYCARF